MKTEPSYIPFNRMDNQEENEQPRQRNTDQVLEELLRTNQ